MSNEPEDSNSADSAEAMLARAQAASARLRASLQAERRKTQADPANFPWYWWMSMFYVVGASAFFPAWAWIHNHLGPSFWIIPAVVILIVIDWVIGKFLIRAPLVCILLNVAVAGALIIFISSR